MRTKITLQKWDTLKIQYKWGGVAKEDIDIWYTGVPWDGSKFESFLHRMGLIRVKIILIPENIPFVTDAWNKPNTGFRFQDFKIEFKYSKNLKNWILDLNLECLKLNFTF